MAGEVVDVVGAEDVADLSVGRGTGQRVKAERALMGRKGLEKEALSAGREGGWLKI